MKNSLKWIMKLKKAIFLRFFNYIFTGLMGIFCANIFSNLTTKFLQADYTEIGHIVLQIIIVLVFTCVIIPIMQYKEANVMETQGAKVDAIFFEEFILKDYKINESNCNIYMNVLWSDFPAYRMNLIYFCSFLGAGLLTTVISVCLIAYHSPLFSILSVLFCCISILLPLHFQKKLEEKREKTLKARDGVSEILRNIFANIEYIRLEKQKNMLGYLLTPKQKYFADTTMNYQKSNILMGCLLNIVMLSAEAVVYMCGCWAIGKQIMDYNILVYIILMTSVTRNGIYWLIEALSCVHDIRSASNRMRSLEINSDADRIEKVETINEITIHNVSYTYEETKEKLAYANMCFKHNVVYWLKGKNGTGKSTLLKILTGFYPNYDGEIKVNGCNFKAINLDEWRQKVGYIPQKPVLFRMTVKENILFGNSSIDNTLYEQLMTMFRLKEIEEKVVEFNGTGISGGEAQCVSIIRELLRKPKILLVDEPFNTLDADRKDIFCKYISKMTDTMFIIVSHHNFLLDREVIYKEIK